MSIKYIINHTVVNEKKKLSPYTEEKPRKCFSWMQDDEKQNKKI